MKPHATEHAGIGKHQTDLIKINHQMVVFGCRLAGGYSGELAGHAKVDAQPRAVVEAKGHLFGGGLG